MEAKPASDEQYTALYRAVKPHAHRLPQDLETWNRLLDPKFASRNVAYNLVEFLMPTLTKDSARSLIKRLNHADGVEEAVKELQELCHTDSQTPPEAPVRLPDAPDDQKRS